MKRLLFLSLLTCVLSSCEDSVTKKNRVLQEQIDDLAKMNDTIERKHGLIETHGIRKADSIWRSYGHDSILHGLSPGYIKAARKVDSSRRKQGFIN